MRKLFKIGDKVTIRADLKEGMNIKFNVNDEMEKMAGKEATITVDSENKFKLDIDNGEWTWNMAMFAEFQLILEKHKKWLASEPDGERADLSNADLRYADLSNADLRYADLSNAVLSNADLRYADLSNAYLSNANLSNAYLSNADLRYADLSNADLSNAENVYIPINCPEKGSFIGFKKALTDKEEVIVELLITEDAKRSSATSRKCRCSKSNVLSITSLDETEQYNEAYSSYDSDFIYEVGKTVEPDSFDEDRFDECSNGIHFFITRQEAVDY